MPLTDTAIRSAKPGDKPRKLADSAGLYLLLHPNGSRYWRFKYRRGGKEKVLALGVYPRVTLAEAREARDFARKTLTAGRDPAVVRQTAKRELAEAGANTFRVVALEWAHKKANHWSPKHIARVIQSLEADVFRDLGHRPIHEITAPELLRVLRIVEKRGVYETAGRLLQRCGAVFRYGIVTGRCERNPAVDLRGSLTSPKKQHYPALTAADLPEFLRRLALYDGNEQTQLAIRLLLLTFVRTAELRSATWSEFELDGDTPTWRVPAERMKSRVEHLVPLSWQAVSVLKKCRHLSKSDSLLFPSERRYDKPMSENTILFALYRMGYKNRATGHGFRATASTILNEQGWRSDVIERQLAHAPRDQVRAAYNRAEYLPERRKMMRAWADYLEGLHTSAEIVPFRARNR